MGRVAAREHGGQVRGNNAAPLLERVFLGWLADAHPRVCHKNVDAAQSVDRVLDHFADLSGVVDVGL